VQPVAFQQRKSTVWRRVSVAAVSAFCAFATLGNTAHFALVQHVACAQHGDLVHADETHPGSTASAAERGARSDSPAFGQGPDAVEGSHEHCVAQLKRREEVGVPSGAFVLDRAQLEPSHALEAEGVSSSIAVLRLAPKASPPVLG
jgi:hypothetical protein